MNSPIKSNKILWDRLAELHFDDPWYKLSAFLQGKSTLNPPEKSLLGEVSGLTCLHLQCHFGLDTLSLAREGAIATGIDFSNVAIEKARALAQLLGLNCSFIASDIYKLSEHLDQKFDRIYTSYGVVDWLPDLDEWAHIISRHLTPGGKFILVEFHPLLSAFDLESNNWKYPYFNHGTPVEEIMDTSYTGRKMPTPTVMNSWSHSISDIVRPLLKVGLTLNTFRELDYSPYNCFPNLVERAPGEYVWKDGVQLPMLLALSFTKHG